MTRALQTISVLLLATSLYLSLLLDLLPVPLHSTIHSEILPVLPFWALITFASYLVGRLGWGVLNFKDQEPAYKELMEQIEGAKEKVKGKGVDI